MKKPLLTPPCPGWKEDLPNSYKHPLFNISIGSKTPNHQDAIYMEIPRPAVSPRGIASALAALVSPTFLYGTYEILLTNPVPSFKSLTLDIATLSILCWLLLVGFRMDISPPRDLPIRFNRPRQRVYAYNYKYRWWNPFGAWEVVPISYDWSQVRAERWSQTGAVSGGLIFKWGVELSIIKPGTNKVIDRFNLSTMDADVHTWAYICTYMQEGPDALPPPGPPKDHNDVLWCEFALRLAPKVSWSPEMDLESRTAP